MLAFAEHNEETGHLDQVPVLKRVQHHTPTKVPPKVKFRHVVRVDIGGGFWIEKEIIK